VELVTLISIVADSPTGQNPKSPVVGIFRVIFGNGWKTKRVGNFFSRDRLDEKSFFVNEPNLNFDVNLRTCQNTEKRELAKKTRWIRL
jgi:hypothetical protein